MSNWRQKANRIIAEMSRQAYREANYNKQGRKYKRHRPYAVPAIAEELVRCLNKDDEQTAKRIFVDLACHSSIDRTPLNQEMYVASLGH